mmetsp:Transcript_2080/g.5476  ORF Transcript_2080/g.5476 Transcript_2080/m.5476 type:complete len:201 (-) Transcript_2080:14-616(-)
MMRSSSSRQLMVEHSESGSRMNWPVGVKVPSCTCRRSPGVDISARISVVLPRPESPTTSTLTYFFLQILWGLGRWVPRRPAPCEASDARAARDTAVLVPADRDAMLGSSPSLAPGERPRAPERLPMDAFLDSASASKRALEDMPRLSRAGGEDLSPQTAEQLAGNRTAPQRPRADANPSREIIVRKLGQLSQARAGGSTE